MINEFIILGANQSNVKCFTQDTAALWGMSSEYYAQYLLSRGEDRAALEQFRAAHETCRKLVGDTHPQTLVLLNSIGDFTKLLKKFFL